MRTSCASPRSRPRAARGWSRSTRPAAEESRTRPARVTLKYFEGGQQGDERDFVRKIKLGQLDGAAVTSIGLAMIDESIRVLELPMLFQSAEELDYVADKMWPYFQKKFEKKGFKLNDRGEVGWIYFLSKNKVESLARPQGPEAVDVGRRPARRRDVQEARPQRRAARRARGRRRPDVAARSTRATARRVAAVALQWYSKVKYMTSMPMSFAIGATVVSLDALKKISAEDQKTVEEIGKASAKKLRKVIRKANEDAKATMTRKGITVVQTAGGDGRRVHQARAGGAGRTSSARSTRRKSSTWSQVPRRVPRRSPGTCREEVVSASQVGWRDVS